ncbi:MAG TPA: YhjD/YihY/BrkB family envelope integrity protein [Xanthomonadaceae bacterium]|nr:YhjD/YihY/BrkB family envelope integrity protein [Xanthomonadaceae bacterium]
MTLQIFALAKRTYSEWSQDGGWIFAGAMTAFAALAAAPITLIVVRLAGAFGQERACLALLAHPLGLVIGSGNAQALGRSVSSSNAGQHGQLAIAVAIVAAIFAASRFTYAMQKAMQTMWSTSESTGPQSLWTTTRDVFVSGTASALGIALLLALLFSGSALFAMARASGNESNVGFPFVQIIAAIGGAAILVPIFGALFKWLPRSNLAWSDIWVGATSTAIVFAVGQIAFGAYHALRPVGSMYDSVSSVVILLLWMYYSAYTLLMGAEFTQVYARMHGSLALERD